MTVVEADDDAEEEGDYRTLLWTLITSASQSDNPAA